MRELIKQAIGNHITGVQQFFSDENILEVEEIAEIIADKLSQKHKVLICGNGGSNCDAIHFAEEFTGRFRKARKPLPVLALSDSSHITCVANDYGFEDIFSRGVEAYGMANDILIGISTSGNSENVLKAINKANDLTMITIGLLGKDGGKINELCDHVLIVKGDTSDRIQEVHITILHIIIELVERKLFPQNYVAV